MASFTCVVGLKRTATFDASSLCSISLFITPAKNACYDGLQVTFWCESVNGGLQTCNHVFGRERIIWKQAHARFKEKRYINETAIVASVSACSMCAYVICFCVCV
jgi:hypothetical protein